MPRYTGTLHRDVPSVELLYPNAFVTGEPSETAEKVLWDLRHHPDYGR